MKIDPKVKQERELRENVIDQTGSTAIQRQYDAVNLKVLEKQRLLLEYKKELVLLKTSNVKEIDVRIFERMHLVANSGSVRTLQVSNQYEDEESRIKKAASE
jgi:hypothetical protein